MRMVDLLNAQEALGVLYELEMSGGKAIKLRRAVREMSGHVSDHQEALRAWDQKEGIDGKRIDELTVEQRRYLEELLSVEVEPSWEPVLEVEDLEGGTVSPRQVDALVIAGLVRDEEPIENGMPLGGVVRG
jgi:hypothetical protein